ncbi:MAG: hypothetical protein ACYS4W_09350 [Planctomycetota bacterium]|jgi:hypothetical protein
MKAAGELARILFVASIVFGGGCESGPFKRTVASDKTSEMLSMYTSYSAAEVDIIPLTEFVSSGTAEGSPEIKAYVSLVDPFGSQVKSPGVFRFELYEYVRHSSESMGRRVSIWPDIDLTGSEENNTYWRDYLRAYEFRLPFELRGGRTHVLQVTCLCPTGRRLSDEFVIKSGE